MLIRLRTRSFELCAVLIFFFGAISVCGHAQSTRGTVSGTVSDQSGGVIVGGAVTLLSPSTGVTSNAVTNSSGIYRFEAVPVGDYVVTATAPGFSKNSAPVIVTVGALVGRDFVLSVSAVGASVEVVSLAAVDLQTEDAVRTQVIPATALAELPIPGQNSLNLILGAPGVVRSNQGGSLDSGIGSVNGARARSNNFLIDGLQNNDISVAGPQFSIFNNDELQEVNFQTSNFSPEFGRAGGAIVSQITKSGTNQIHGTIATVYRSEIFNASTQTQRVNFNNGSTPVLKNKFKENIPAFTIGGPVVIPHIYDGRDKTFFFAGGQWDRYSANNNSTFTAVPTANGLATLQALAAGCPNVALYLASLSGIVGSAGTGSSPISIALPANLASTSCSGGARTGQSVEVGQYTRVAPEVFLDNNHLIRFDHVASNKQNMMFRWLYDYNVDNIAGTVGINSQFDVPNVNRTMGANFNHVYAFKPNLLNEFRFGYVRANLGFFIPAGQTLAATLPQNIITSLTTLQLSSSFPQGRISNSFEYQDAVTFTKGKHSFKGGAEILRQLAVQVAPFNGRGTVAYSNVNTTFTGGNTITGLANFIDNFGGTSTAPVNISFGSGKYRPNLFTVSAFLQDTFKVTPNLTLVYGARYENFGQPANGFKYPAFVGFGDSDITSTAKVNQDNNNFGPTVGFSYSPHVGTYDGSLVIRGGYQVTYDAQFNNILSNLAAGSPNALANNPVPSVSTLTTPRGTANLSAVLPTLVPLPVTPYSNATSILAQNVRNPYYHHFSFGIQQAIPGSIVLDVAYVGTLGRQLYFTNPLNPALPKADLSGVATQTVSVAGVPTSVALRVHPNRGLVQIRDSGLTSNYHSLQVQVRRRAMQTVAGSLIFSSSYTWSKNLDVLTEIFVTNSSPQNPSRSPVLAGSLKSIDYGPSDNDRRHVSSTYMELDVRSPKNHFLGEILGGWSVAPIFTVQSGTPYTVTDDLDRDLDGSTIGDRADIGNLRAPINTRGLVTSACNSGFYNPAISSTPANACVNRTDVHFIQVTGYSPVSPAMERRNVNRTTRYLDLDTNIIKKFRVNERFNAELRGEFFNITNNQNFDTPPSATNRSVTAATGTNFLNFGLQSGGGRTFRVGAKILF